VDPGEECDPKSAGHACSSTCQVDDFLAAQQLGPDGGLANPARTLGRGRHPVAAAFDNTFAVTSLDLDHLTPSLAGFGPNGAPLGPPVPLNAQSTVVDESAPVVAALPCSRRFVAAWAQMGGAAGDELDIALRIVDPLTIPTGPPAVANTNVASTQRDPDVLAVGDQIVVAWEDDSNPATAPDVVLRTFDANLGATSAEQPLASSSDSESDVALAAFAGSWAAAWRDDANGLETVQIETAKNRWSIQPPFMPAPAGTKPALVALDATHLLVVYVVGLDRTGSGVANGSKLQAAVLSTSAPGAVNGADLPAQVSGASGLDQSLPAVANVQGNPFVAWWTAAAPGDANGEQLWLKRLRWSAGALDQSTSESSLPRWPQAQLGDQRAPALAASTLAPGGALVAAWDDLGKTLASGEGDGDVVVELAPVPILRTAGDGGP
jgi:hypothetical protein